MKEICYTTQLTCSTMEMQNEKGDIDSNENLVNKLRTSLSHIEPVLIKSFGCDGLSVFIQKSNGNILLTRSGLEIIENVLLIGTGNSKSIGTFVLRYCKKINETLGDGIKRFIIYVNVFIKLLQSDKNLICKRLKQLEILQFVLNQSKSECFPSYEIPCTLNKNKLELIIKSFMVTRFTLSVALTFSELVFIWMSSFYSDGNVSSNNIKLLLKNLNVLCVKNSEAKSLSESKVQNGFLVKGKINNIYKNYRDTLCILKICIFDGEDKSLDNSNIFESDIIRLVTEIDLENLDNVNKILLVTNVTLSDSLLFYLRMRNVVSAEGVEIEDIIFLNDFLLKNCKNQEFTTNLNYFNDTSILISLSDISQLILCTPTIDLWSQLRDSLRNLITLINYSLTGKATVYDIDSMFEQLIYDCIFKKRLNRPRKPPLFVSNRKELMNWHSSRTDFNNENHLNSKILSNFPHKDVITDEDTKNLMGFVSSFVDCIISKNELKDCSFVNFLGDLFYYILRVLKPKGYSSDCNFIYVELIAVKLSILNYAIDFILCIFNISSLVRTKRRIASDTVVLCT